MTKFKCNITFPTVFGAPKDIECDAEYTLRQIVLECLGNEAKFIMNDEGKTLAHVHCFLNGAPVKDLNYNLSHEKNELLFLTSMSGG